MNRRAAFTLVELLVIVAIIALLISVLVPSFTAARMMAKEIKCRSNLGQIGRAMHLYLEENNDVLPYCYAKTQDVVITCWAPRLRALAGYRNGIFYCPTRPKEWQWRQIFRGDPDAPSGGNVRFANSADVGNYGFKTGEMLPVGKVIPFSYGWNDWGAAPAFTRAGMSGDEWGGEQWKVTAYMLDRPSGMIAITDKQPTPPNSWWGFNIDPTSWWEHPGRPHRDGCGVLWADAHVEWRETDSIIIGDNSQNPGGWNSQQRSIAHYWNNNNDWRPRN